MNPAQRLIVPVVSALAIVVASPMLWWAGFELDAWAVAFALWQAMPFGVLLALHRWASFSGIGTVVTAVVVAGLTVVGYIAIERSESSTAGIALIYTPIWLAVLVFIAWLVDLALRWAAERGSRTA